MTASNAELVRSAFLQLQESIRGNLFEIDTRLKISEDEWIREEGGGGRTWAFEKGQVLEKGEDKFFGYHRKSLPPAATHHRKELTGLPFRAMGVSIVFTLTIPTFPPVMRMYGILKQAPKTIPLRGGLEEDLTNPVLPILPRGCANLAH